MSTSTDNKFTLKWNDYEDNWRRSLTDCRRKNKFCDVTLLSEDFSHVPAHKIILSGSSGFFESIFQKCDSLSQPVIYLKGVKLKDLNHILSFIYTGEVGVKQEDLKSFLGAAAELKIKGLSEGHRKNHPEGPLSSLNKKTKYANIDDTSTFKSKTSSPKKVEQKVEDQIDRVQNYGLEEDIEISEDRTVESHEPPEITEIQRKRIKKSLIKSVGNGYSLAWSCELCKRIFSSKKVAVSHVEMEHQAENYFPKTNFV